MLKKQTVDVEAIAYFKLALGFIGKQYMRIIVIVFALFISACATQQVEKTADSTPESEVVLAQGVEKLSNRKMNDAIADFDHVIAICEEQYADSEKRIYAARGMAETLFYLLKAVADEEEAIAVNTTCSDALYLRGYLALDFGDITSAEQYLKRAIDMAPANAIYLSELGHIYHAKRDWKNALDIFTQAEEVAEEYSPEDVKVQELSRAKRGVGYSLIELGDLDSAEIKFKECLEIDQNDQGALKELEYIAHLRKNEQTGPGERE